MPSTTTRTRIQDLRRTELISATLRVINATGFSEASASRIAAEAGVSKSVFFYYFKTKDELIEVVIATFFEELKVFMVARMDSTGSASQLLRSYITANLLFVEQHREDLAAIIQIMHNTRRNGEVYMSYEKLAEKSYQKPMRIFKHGQSIGEFRDFDPLVMAKALRNVIDSTVVNVVQQKPIDLGRETEELCQLFIQACIKTKES